jgi:hypothetical protein
LWVAVTSRHSDCAAALPLRMNRSMRRLYLTDRTPARCDLPLGVELAAPLAGELLAHLLIAFVLSAGAFALAHVPVRWREHLDALLLDGLHLSGVPVAGVGEHHLRGLLNPLLA